MPDPAKTDQSSGEVQVTNATAVPVETAQPSSTETPAVLPTPAPPAPVQPALLQPATVPAVFPPGPVLPAPIVPVNLPSLLLDLTPYPTRQAVLPFARQTYIQTYVGGAAATGTPYLTHDGMPVVFDSSRFDHAFMTSSNPRGEPDLKDVPDWKRIERLHWIAPIIAGELAGVACRTQSPYPGYVKRAYLYEQERYVVWLEPAKEGGWWFSSAYVPRLDIFRNYQRSTKHLWMSR